MTIDPSTIKPTQTYAFGSPPPDEVTVQHLAITDVLVRVADQAAQAAGSVWDARWADQPDDDLHGVACKAKNALEAVIVYRRAAYEAAQRPLDDPALGYVHSADDETTHVLLHELLGQAETIRDTATMQELWRTIGAVTLGSALLSPRHASVRWSKQWAVRPMSPRRVACEDRSRANGWHGEGGE